MNTTKTEALAVALEDIQGLTSVEGTTVDKAAAELRRLDSELERLTTEQAAPVHGPDYAWPTVADYEKDVGFEVNQAFKMAWNMARTTNGFLNLLSGEATTPAAQPAPSHPDDLAVDRFAAAMKAKMAKAREKGRCGWETCQPDDLSRMLREHVEKGDPRDVANFCMMIWSLGAGIAAAPPAPVLPHCEHDFKMSPSYGGYLCAVCGKPERRK